MLKVLRNLFESWKASSSKLRYVEFIINEKEIRLDSFFFLEERNRKRIVRRFFFFIFILALSIVIFLLPPPPTSESSIYTARIYRMLFEAEKCTVAGTVILFFCLKLCSRFWKNNGEGKKDGREIEKKI